jgi:hypothetical protein
MLPYLSSEQVVVVDVLMGSEVCVFMIMKLHNTEAPRGENRALFKETATTICMSCHVYSVVNVCHVDSNSKCNERRKKIVIEI